MPDSLLSKKTYVNKDNNERSKNFGNCIETVKKHSWGKPIKCFTPYFGVEIVLLLKITNSAKKFGIHILW
jgi:hypothetical protein